MIKIKVTNEQGAALVLPMIVSKWGNPEFTEEDGARLIAHTGDSEAWHDITYMCWDGGQMTFAFKPEGSDAFYCPYAYEITLDDKPVVGNELIEYCDTYWIKVNFPE